LRSSSIPNPAAARLVIVFFLLAGMTSFVYALAGVRPGAAYAFLNWLGDSVVIANWIVADRQSRGDSMRLDTGFYVYIASWPVALGYYLIVTRGVRGVLLLLWVVALFIATALPVAIISYVRQ